MKELNAKELESVSGGVTAKYYGKTVEKLLELIGSYDYTDRCRCEVSMFCGQVLDKIGACGNETGDDAARSNILEEACNYLMKGGRASLNSARTLLTDRDNKELMYDD